MTFHGIVSDQIKTAREVPLFKAADDHSALWTMERSRLSLAF